MDNEKWNSKKNLVFFLLVFIFLIVAVKAAPVMQNLIVNSTTGNNYTTDNLTVYANATAASGINVSYDGKWYKNGVLFVNKNWNASYGRNQGRFDDYGYTPAVDSQGFVYIAGFSNSSGPDIGANPYKGFIVKYDSGGNKIWNLSYTRSEPDVDNFFNTFKIDSLDNLYAAGYLINDTGLYGLIVKYNSSGANIMNVTSQLYTNNNLYYYGIDVDSSGNIYVAAEIGASGSNENSNFSIIKYNNLGTMLWNVSVDYNKSDDVAYGVSVVGSNIYATGFVTNSTSNEMFYTAEYTSSGAAVWNKTFQRTLGNSSYAFNIATDSFSNVYAVGEVDTALLRSVGIVSYNSSGARLWNSTYNLQGTATAADLANGIFVDPLNNIYVGATSGNITNSLFNTLKYNSTGSLLWNKTSFFGPYNATAYGIAGDLSGDVYVAGQTYLDPNYSNDILVKYSDGFLYLNTTQGVSKNISVIASSLLSDGDNWTICARAFDGQAYSDFMCRNITIQNNHAFSGQGNGTIGEPYQITNCTQLQEMSNNLSANYVLTNNVNCSDTKNWNSGLGFNPVGDSSNSFIGTLNGENYNITELFIGRLQNYVGLFGYMSSSSAVVSNLGLTSVNITKGSYVGGIAGEIDTGAKLTNTYVYGNINGTNDVGGLVGYGVGQIYKSYSNVIITGNNHIGGIIGTNNGGVIRDVYSAGNTTGNSWVGGAAGYIAGLFGIYNAYSTSEVYGLDCVGGLVGHSYGNLGGEMIASSFEVDGRIIILQNEPSIVSSFSAGIVSGNTNIGGLLGCSSGPVMQSSNYWDNVTSGQLGCSGDGLHDCTGISDVNYFKGTGVHANTPMDGWNFDIIWQAIASKYPQLNVRGSLTASLVYPTLNTIVIRGDTFSFNSSVDCAGGSCVGVYASLNPAVVNTTIGATPFYTVSGNPQACNDLADGGSCANNWTIYATGSAADYEFYVSYNSTNPGINWVNTSFVNITINFPPKVTIVSPAATTYTSSTVNINIGIDETGYCEYSLNAGVINNTLTANSSNTGFTGTSSSLANGNYVLAAYCNDSVGAKNYTETRAFTISVSAPSGGGGGGGGSVCIPDYSSCIPYVPNPTGIIYGDLNADGKITVADVSDFIRIILGITTMPPKGSGKFVSADVNGDNIINTVDLNLVVDRVLGRINKFPIEPAAPKELVPECNNGQMQWVCKDSKCGLPDKKEYRACDVNCVPDYSSCGAWSACKDNLQGRTCEDTNCNYLSKDFAQMCSSCASDWQCSAWGSCLNGTIQRVCTDKSSCAIPEGNKPNETMSCKSCTPNIVCGDWSACEYSLDDSSAVLTGAALTAKKTRYCEDKAGCGAGEFQTQSCSSAAGVTVSREGNFVSLLDSITGAKVACIGQNGWTSNGTLDILFTMENCTTPGTCFDGIMNGNETGTDCGGECKSCGLSVKRVAYESSWYWLVLVFLSLLLVYDVLRVRQEYLMYDIIKLIVGGDMALERRDATNAREIYRQIKGKYLGLTEKNENWIRGEILIYYHNLLKLHR